MLNLQANKSIIDNGIDRITSANLFLSNSITGESKMTKSTLPLRPKSIKICSVEGCQTKGRILLGYCVKHYRRFKKFGNPLLNSRNFGEGNTYAERFWSKVSLTANPYKCWLWQAGTGGGGYGNTTFEGKARPAHVISFFLLHEKMPKLQLLHSCDNPLCVNPNHLREGTQAENMQDMVKRGRSLKGSKSPNAKLNESKVREIKQLLGQKVKKVELARKFNVSRDTIRKIGNEKIWKQVN